MIEFSSSLKLNEIHIIDFNEDPKNIIFSQGGPNLGEGRLENLEKMGNNRDIYCYANQEWSISKEKYPTPWYQNPCNASIFRPNFREKKMKKLNFQAKILRFFRVLPYQNIRTYSKIFI